MCVCPLTAYWSISPATCPFMSQQSLQLCLQINTCNFKCYLIQNTEIGNHALPNLLPPPPHQSGIRCKISSLNFCFRTQTSVLLSGSPGQRGRVCPRLPLLSSHGPLASPWPSSVRRRLGPHQALIPKRRALQPSSGPTGFRQR